jgi:hypothetical protein
MSDSLFIKQIDYDLASSDGSSSSSIDDDLLDVYEPEKIGL